MDYFTVQKLLAKNAEQKLAKKLSKQPVRKLGSMLLDAIANKDTTIATLLLDFGASPNTQNYVGETALMYACHYANTQLVKELIERGANVNILARIPFSSTMDETNVAYIVSRLDKALKYSTKSTIRHRCPKVNALMYCAASRFNGDTSQIAQIMIATGKIDVNSQDAEGFSALMYAVESGNYEVAKVLLSSGANPNLTDQYGNTALMYAVNRMYTKFMIKLLVSNGADTNIKNSFGESATDMAERTKIAMGIDWLELAKTYKQTFSGRKTCIKVSPEFEQER